MKLYSNKQRWKIVLLFIAIGLVGASLYISNDIVQKVAMRERERVTQWADAIKKRAELVRLTNHSFDQLRDKELAEMELWIAATKEISKSTPLNFQQSYDLPLKIINRNNDIPVIVLDQDRNVSTYINLDFSIEEMQSKHPDLEPSEVKRMFDSTLVRLAFSWVKINPSFTIEIYDDLFMTYFYNDSRDLLRLEKERDSLIQAFNKELIENPDLVPVVLMNSDTTKVIATNLDSTAIQPENIRTTLEELKGRNEPISIQFTDSDEYYVFYANSPELSQLQLFPYIQFLIIGLFIFIGYIIFSTFRKAEQNQVWAGMAKETAHQLGTPLSSLMAWIELLRNMDMDKSIPEEMNKDIERLTKITDRFSKIGTGAQLSTTNIVETSESIFEYLKSRSPKKVNFNFQCTDATIEIPHNAPLLEWVIENICKNAIDAMEGEGDLTLSITQESNKVIIDISDTGKGMTPKEQRSVFKPGFTTKRRGWGLGLSLAQRIIKEYHKGRLFILKSELGKGTTFRIQLSV